MSRGVAVAYIAALVGACGAPSSQRPDPTDDAGVPDRDGGPPVDGGSPDAGPDGGQPDGGGGSFYLQRPSPVDAENQRPGSRAWQCASYNAGLAGYADHTSYLPGEQVAIRAAFASGATTASWQLWRLGYYGGAQGRLIASGGAVPVAAQPANVVDPTTGAVSAPWPVAVTFTVPSDALTGVYLVKLKAPQGDTLVPLVVR